VPVNSVQAGVSDVGVGSGLEGGVTGLGAPPFSLTQPCPVNFLHDYVEYTELYSGPSDKVTLFAK